MNMKNENTPKFTTEQIASSLRSGAVLAQLHSSCTALEQLSAQILTTSAPENVSRKRSAVATLATNIERLLIDLVDTCIDFDKDLVLSINEKSNNKTSNN